MHTPNLRYKFVRRSLLPGLVTGLLLSQSALTMSAQDNTANPPNKDNVVVLDTFKVTAGFAGSLAAAAEAKQNNQQIVEVIMAEDIGKLPDVSIADSLTRLTGVAAQRVNGRAQNISIRGLTGDFSTTMLNGREQVSTNDNRGVEFDQYPSELLNSVIVYKTASADLPNQGIAGSVDLITVSPLSKTGRQMSANAYYKTTELGLQTPGVKKDGYSASFSYLDQYDGGKVGLALGYARTLTPFEGQQFQAWGYNQDAGGNYEITGTKSYVRSSNLTRDGYMGVLEFKPSDNIHSTIDAYYSKFEENQVLRGMEMPLYPSWSPTSLSNTTVDNGYVTAGTYTNVHPVIRNDSFVRNDTLFSLGWNLKINEQGTWPVVFDAGYSRTNRNDKNLETWSGFSRSVTGDTVTYKANTGNIPVFTPTYNYTDTSRLFVTDAAGWNGTSPTGADRPGYYKGFYNKDELGQFKLYTKHELNKFFMKDVEIGSTYTDRYKAAGQNPSGFEDLSGSAQTAPFPASIGATDMSFLGLGKIAAFDPFKLIADTLTFEPNQGTDFVAQRFQVWEKVWRPYVKFDIDNKIGDVPVTGNLGFQLNSVDQSSAGYSANGNLLTPVRAGAKYNDFAPSLNLNFKVADQTFVRFSVARQLARPRMYDMKASRSWSYNSTNSAMTDIQHSPWSGDGGNPELRPWKSDSIDLSFDRYFHNNEGYVSLAFFDKKLLNYIYEAHSVQDFTGYPVVTGGQPALFQGVNTTPVNGQGGNIKGIEFTLSLSSELLTHKAVRGFGVIMGGAYTDSSVQPWGPGNGTSPINGLSRKVGNVTLYYENKGFSVRVSEHYRSDYRAYVTNFGVPQPKGDINPGGGFATTQAEKQVDAQVSYSFNQGQLKGLSLYLQAYNLNDSPLVTYNNGDPHQVINYQKYGASYSAGVSYKF
ncbi:MAG TPA: TonB-dependent receptor [Lacunisphaera sp.]|nr:TonB-dependent receptor [Lacunisphaera sp.]